MIGTRVKLMSTIAVAAIAATAFWLYSTSGQRFLSRVDDVSSNPAGDRHAKPGETSNVRLEPGDTPPNGSRSSSIPGDRTTVRSFGEAYPILVLAAADGDQSAAIALAKGLASCAERADLRTRFGDLQSRAERLTKIATSTSATEKDKQAMDRSILLMDEAKARLDAKEVACNGIPEEAIKNRWQQQLAAAKTGDPDMIVDFITHPAVDPREAFGDEGGIRAYRETAPALLEQLIREGDLRGYQAYVRAGYDSLMRREDFRFHDALSRAMKPDPVRVLAYDIALGQSGLVGVFGSGPDHEALKNRQLDPAQRLAAEAMAREIAPEVAASVSNWLRLNPPQPTGG